MTEPSAIELSQQQKQQAISAPNPSRDALNALWQHAKMLAGSSLVPEAYRNKPENCVIAIELAARLGSAPLMVMQSLDVIHGNPSWRSKFLIASVNSTGKFTPLRFKQKGKGTKDWSCIAYARDIDPTTGELGPELEGPEITLKMAQEEGWATKNGSKWKTMPELMLMYRAAAFWARVYAPEVSMGLHTSEEREDMLTVPAQRNNMPDDIRAALLTEGVSVTAPVTQSAPVAASQNQEQQASTELDRGDNTDNC